MTYRNGKALLPSATDVQPSATNVQPSATNVQPSAIDVQPSAIDVQPSAIDVQPSAIDVQPSATNVQSAAEKSQRNLAHFAATASIDTQLVAAQITIDKVLGNPQLQARMAAHGYPATRMRHGRALRDQALALHQQQQDAYGAQIAATDARMALQRQAKITYASDVATARVALRDNRSMERSLDLETVRKRTRAGWLIQAQQFYANLLAHSTRIASMKEYGVTYEQLVAAQQTLVAIEAALTAQQDTKDAAKEATKTRDLALKALSRWMLDFQAIARVELAKRKNSEASNASSSS